MASQDVKTSRFEADFKQYQSEVTNKLDAFLKAFNDQMMGLLPSDTVKNPKLNINPTPYARSHPAGDPQSSSNSFKSLRGLIGCAMKLLKSKLNAPDMYLVKLTSVKIDEDSRPGSGDAIWKFQTASGLKWDAIWIMETASGSAVKFEDPKKP
ncbi:hypothetical protein Tco_1183739 [Tanacetum coccineum]